MKYKTVVCGGTFDLLHKGHRSFLIQIFNQTEKVVIGLTSDIYTNKFKVEVFENFKTRKEKLQSFLHQEKVYNRVKIVAINDIYGPLLDKNFAADAIAVTDDTKKGANEINKKRNELGLSRLEILVFKMDLAEDGKVISSRRIRNGEINRNGKLFIKQSWIGKTFKLPKDLREELHKPFGKILKAMPKNIVSDRTITIGDITTQKFIAAKKLPFISIVDFVVEREKKFNNILDLGFLGDSEVKKVDNPAGEISAVLFNAVIKSFNNDKKKIILVNGEEDLAVLPVLLSSPLNYFIYYGQPGVGLVKIEVTEEIKEKGYQLLYKFDY